MRKRVLLLVFGLLALGAVAIVACGAGFDPQSKVDSVRMFAVRADKPYAKPGETVTLEALVTDARRDKARPMKLFWIPIVCLNPPDDLYYLCFAGKALGDAGAQLLPAGPLADAIADAGADASAPPAADAGGNPLSRIPVGVDLSAFLPQGLTFSFRMPENAVQEREGSDPYGLAIVFNMLCAGKVVLAPLDPAAGPQQVPLQCVDENGQRLPPTDYVLGISRVYAYDTKTNTNPVIEKMTADGIDVDPSRGVELPKCVADRRADCPEHKLGVVVADSSWEDNPNETVSGRTLREQIWVDWYSDHGEFQDDARLLFDTQTGRVSDSDDTYRSPYDPVSGTIWAVVHDNRGGASWLVVPLHVN